MNADAEFDAPIRRQASVALDHPALHLDRAAHGVHHAAELDDRAVAGALDDAAVMSGDGGVDDVAAEAPQARERAILVRAGEPAVADHIGDQDCRKFAGLAHRACLRVPTLAQMPAPVCLFSTEGPLIAFSSGSRAEASSGSRRLGMPVFSARAFGA